MSDSTPAGAKQAGKGKGRASDKPKATVKVVSAKPGPAPVPQADILKQARINFVDCRVRAVNPTLNGEFHQNQSLLAGYLNLQNTEEVRTFITTGICFDKAIDPWAQIRESDKWHIKGRTLALEKKVFMKVFATHAGLFSEDEDVDQGFEGPQATLQDLYNTTIRAIKFLIKHGPPEMFWRTQDACPWKLGPADWIGGYIAEDVSRALEVLQHAVRERHKEKAKTSQKRRPHNNQAECIYYLTAEDLSGQGEGGVAEKLSADHFSHIDFEARQKDALELDIAAHPALTPEEQHQLGLKLDHNIGAATAEFNRLTTERGVNEDRPSLTFEQQSAFAARMLQQVQIVWPRPDDSSASADAPSTADRETLTSLAQETEQLTAINEARKVTAAGKDPQQDGDNIELDRQEKLKFQQSLVSSAAALPTYLEGVQYLNLDIVPLEDLAPIDPELHKTDRDAFLKALVPHANPQFTENLRLSPHQVTGVAGARMMETSPLRGAILADDMGLGKTISGLSIVLAGKRSAVRDALLHPVGTKTYKPTLVVAPSACLLAWRTDGIKFFSRELTFHYFFGTPSTAAENDRSRTIGSNVNDLKAHVANLDPHDPETEKHVYCTTVGTWAHRVIKLKEGAQSGRAANPSAKNVEQYRTNEDDEDLEVMDDEIDEDDYEHLCQGIFGRIIVDEAHCLKGLRTKAHKSVVEAFADSTILMTGTPISNRLHDFAGMLRILWRDEMEPVKSDIETSVETYTDAMEELQATFAGMTAEEKLSADNFSDFLYLLNPARFGRLARENDKQLAYHATGVGAAIIPPVFSLCVIARSQGSITQLGPHQVVCAEIPSPIVKVVELKMLYAQRIKYRAIHLDEASRATSGPGDNVDDNDSAAFGSSASTRRLVMASCNALLDAFHTKGHAAARIFMQTLGAAKGANEIPARATEFYHRLTRPEAWLPPYSASRILDAEYQCSLSGKKAYLIGRVMQWLAEGRKVVLFGNWPQTIFDIEVLLNTMCIPFVSVKALSQQTLKQRDKAVARFQDKDDPAKVMVTSLRVAGVSYNFQVASAMIMFDYPPAAAIGLQAIARICRMGQEATPIVEILLAHNSVDQIIASRTESKHIPIIAGNATLTADQYEVENAMRADTIPETKWVENYDHYEKQVIHEKATRIYRMMFGSRCSHVPWSDFNVDLIDFLPNGLYENQPAKKKVVDEQWRKDLAQLAAEKKVSKNEAMKIVAEAAGMTVVDLSRMLEHKDSLLGSLAAGTVGSPASGIASKKKPAFRTKPVAPSGSSPFTPSKTSAPQPLSAERVDTLDEDDDLLSNLDPDEMLLLESQIEQTADKSPLEKVVRGPLSPSLPPSQPADDDASAGGQVDDDKMDVDTPAEGTDDLLLASPAAEDETPASTIGNEPAVEEGEPAPSPFALDTSRVTRASKRKPGTQEASQPNKRRRTATPKTAAKASKPAGKGKKSKKGGSDEEFEPEE